MLRKKWLFSLLAFCSGLSLIVLNRNENSATPQNFAMPNAKRVVHPNGLTLLVPQNYIADRQSSGFMIRPKNGKDYRYPTSIDVTIVNGKDYPKSKLNSTTKIAGRTIDYAEEVNEDQGASGAPDYSVSAYETTKKGVIKYEQSKQSENGPPDLTLLWPVIANTQLR